MNSENKVYTQILKAKDSINFKNIPYTGKGVTIAFLDTGIAPIEDFRGRIIYFKDLLNSSTKLYDDNGHGTHIAAIACGNGLYKGIAPYSSIVMLKVLNQDGQGNASDVISALEWIGNNHSKYNIKVLNMSIGTAPSAGKDPLVEAVEYLWDKGITVVAAAGNNGPGYGTISSPGTSKKIITAASYSQHLTGVYSGRGPTSECIIKPDILAPGDNIISCKNKNGVYAGLSGTSVSTPIVSGVIALLLEKEPALSPNDIKYMLKLSAKDLKLEPNRQGWGLLDAGKLLNMEAVYVRNYM